jgi:superfamily II DNA/RNA helicase
MSHEFWRVMPGDRIEVAAAAAAQAQRTIVFVRTKRGADRLAPRLTARGVRAAALHGGLRQGVRERTLDRFTKGAISTLVATDVAARGIHVDGVDLVLQFDPPVDAKTYLHRAGRTARAGRSGTAVSLVTDEQRADTQALQRRLGLQVPLLTTAPDSAHVAALAAG